MFIATFSQTSSEKFTRSTQTGELPFIGTLVAGKAHGTIINHDIFVANQCVPNQMYLCTETPATKEGYEHLFNIVVLQPVTAVEAVTLLPTLGKPVRIGATEKPVNESTEKPEITV